MAKILPFATDGANRKRKAPVTGGDVVIFPGIRVEYHDGAPQPDAKGRQRRGANKDVLSA